MIHYPNLRSDTLCRRLFCRVEIRPNGCWVFLGGLRDGYGRIQFREKNLSVHRVSWELWNGPVPRGSELHHTCANTACCNPLHLQPVTPRVHTRDLTPGHIAATNAAKTHCPKGHALTDGNLVLSVLRDGRRSCLTCKRESTRLAMRRLHSRRKEG